jgi:hypothetical protein
MYKNDRSFAVFYMSFQGAVLVIMRQAEKTIKRSELDDSKENKNRVF